MKNVQIFQIITVEKCIDLYRAMEKDQGENNKKTLRKAAGNGILRRDNHVNMNNTCQNG